MKLGVLIYTYNRVDDAKINMELIRNLWQKDSKLADIKIVHSFNGEPQWYPEKYLEDELVVSQNSNHFQGASDLIDSGMVAFQQNFPDLDFVIVLASDTWLIKPDYIKKVLLQMRSENKYLASCSWGLADRNDIFDVGIATDFLIVNLPWALKNKMFPLRYSEFDQKYGELILYQRGYQAMLEKIAVLRFLQALQAEFKSNVGLKQHALAKLLCLVEREPVHYEIEKDGLWQRTAYWETIGLLTHHEPEPKKEILEKNKITKGKNIQKLLNNSNLDYYNQNR